MELKFSQGDGSQFNVIASRLHGIFCGGFIFGDWENPWLMNPRLDAIAIFNDLFSFNNPTQKEISIYHEYHWSHDAQTIEFFNKRNIKVPIIHLEKVIWNKIMREKKKSYFLLIIKRRIASRCFLFHKRVKMNRAL